MERSKAIVLALSALVGIGSAGCSGPSEPSGTEGRADAGGRQEECPEAPESPSLDSCAQWQCEAVEAPTCWQCEPIPAEEGTECSEAEAGACTDGECRPVPDPAASGPGDYEIAEHRIEVEEEEIALDIYRSTGSGTHPVLVFTHGFMLDPSSYSSYGEHLASWGYTVVMPKLPGNLLFQKTHRELADLLVGVFDWVDATAVDAEGVLGEVDASMLGLVGHSMGGKLSLLLAAEDSRVRAAFGIDPVDAAGSPLSNDPEDFPSVTPELMPQIQVPIGLLGETVNAEGGLGQPCAPAEDNFQQYFEHALSPAIQIEVVGASHMSFLDDPDCGLACSMCPSGTDDPSLTRSLAHGYMTAFFELLLRGDVRYSIYLTGQPMQSNVAAGLVVVESKNGF